MCCRQGRANSSAFPNTVIHCLVCAGAYFAATHLCQVFAWAGSRKPRFEESMLDVVQERIMSEPYGDEPCMVFGECKQFVFQKKYW